MVVVNCGKWLANHQFYPRTVGIRDMPIIQGWRVGWLVGWLLMVTLVFTGLRWHKTHALKHADTNGDMGWVHTDRNTPLNITMHKETCAYLVSQPPSTCKISMYKLTSIELLQDSTATHVLACSQTWITFILGWGGPKHWLHNYIPLRIRAKQNKKRSNRFKYIQMGSWTQGFLGKLFATVSCSLLMWSSSLHSILRPITCLQSCDNMFFDVLLLTFA